MDENDDIQNSLYICHHLLDNQLQTSYRYFTGKGTECYLICADCKENIADISVSLRPTTLAQFDQFDIDHVGYIGEPEILVRQTDLIFTHRRLRVEGFTGIIRCIVPRQEAKTSQWIALLTTGEIISLDLIEGRAVEVARLPSAEIFMFTHEAHLSLHLSSSGQYAAIVDDKGMDGLVIDITTGAIVLRLNRGNYFITESRFPIVFFNHQDKTLIVHGTDWNRLDISDVATGELLTARQYEEISKGNRPPHYLDYFHGFLMISPNLEWIAEDGLIWHPFGITRVWNLHRWLVDNVWESEDGKSVQRLNYRDYYWNSPMCWVDNHQLAVWGWGSDKTNLASAVQIFDVQSNPYSYRVIAGVKEGQLYYDRYLFAVSKQDIEVWDIDSGERLLSDSSFQPISYHHGAGEFVTLRPDGEFQLSRLSS